MLHGYKGINALKICVSSRPLNVFQDAFADCLSLRLELLTRADICAYVEDTLTGHPHFKTMKNIDPAACHTLITNVTDKASGVFLRVFLVVQELQKGLSNGLALRHLHKRLDQLPSDLDEYFLSMLESIEESDRATSSQIFQVVLGARDQVSLMTLSFW